MDLKKRLQSLVRTKAKSSTDQDVSAENFADEPAVLKFKDHLHEVQHDPRIDQEVISSITKDYFVLDDFDVVHAELSRLPTKESITLSQIEADRNKLRRQLQSVSKRVSDRILENEALYATELQRVMDLQQTLQQALCVCSDGRRKMTMAREQFTTASLKLLANYRKRQQLASLMYSLRTIKTLQRTDVRLREMMEKEDYAGAIELCLECQKAASIFSHYKCISELRSKLQDTLEAIEEQLDTALARTCARFSEAQYERVHAAYALLGKTQTAMDQLHMHFTSAVHNTAFTIVLGYVELCAGVGDSGFHKKQYGELVKAVEAVPAQHVQPQMFTPCLTDLCKALWGVMISYYQAMQWHSARDSTASAVADVADSSLSVEESFTRKYVKQKLEQGQVRLWQEIQLKVRTFFLASDLSHFKFDEFIHILNIVNRLMELGEEFSKGKSEVLQEAIKSQTSNYFRHYHRASMEELKMFLENEGWELCPVKPTFVATQLQEFAFMRAQEKQQQLSKGRSASAATGTAAAAAAAVATVTTGDLLQQKADRFLSFVSGAVAPFDLPREDEDEREDVFATNGEKASDDSDSDKDIPDELKVDFVDENVGDPRAQQQQRLPRRQEYSKKRAAGSTQQGDGAVQPMLTNTALTVLRLFGKYIRMMTMLTPIAFNVILSMSQLFDYYFYAVYMNFAASQMADGAEKVVSGKLLATLVRIRNGLMQSDGSVSPAVSTALGSGDEASSTAALAANEKFAMPRLSHAAATVHGGKMFGLLERIVAVESLVYLGKQFECLLPHLDSIIPPVKKAFLQQFQSQTIATAAELRQPAYKATTDRVLNQEHVIGQIASSKWDIRDIMSQHSDYVDGILRDLVTFGAQLKDLGGRMPLSRDVKLVLWEQCSRTASQVFVDGYACVKHCTNEGRALMQLDYQQFIVKFEKMTDLRPLPGRELVEAYIKAYYLPDAQLEAWIKEHKEYSNKQLGALVSCVAHLNKKAKARLLALIEDPDKGGGSSSAGSAGAPAAMAASPAPSSSRKDPFQQLAALSSRKSLAS